MTLKIALFAPIPSASAIIEITVNPGIFVRNRIAYRTPVLTLPQKISCVLASFVAQFNDSFL